MIFTIAVHGAPYETQANEHALAFCEATVAAGHQIAQVFFYHGGVNVANGAITPPQGQRNLSEAWLQLSQSHNVELAVCIANGLKRGILSADEAKRYGNDHATIGTGFELVGLGQLIAATLESDRYIEFPA